MNKKSFLLGVLTGCILTFVIFIAIGYIKQYHSESDPIQYFEEPKSYENKQETTFKVLQVLGKAALANEVSSEEFDLYMGNTVVILGGNFYSDQIVTIKAPQFIGTYSYTTNGGMPKTVPVIHGEIVE